MQNPTNKTHTTTTKLLNQDWNFGAVTNPFHLLIRPVKAAPNISRTRFWFWLTRNMLQEDSNLWWWQMEPMREYCKNHCEACAFLPGRDSQPEISSSVMTFRVRKRQTQGQGFSSLIAYCIFGRSPSKEDHLSFLLCHSSHMDTIVFAQQVARLSL